MTSLRKDTFSYCGLESIDIPENITAIKCGVFAYCNQLTSVTLPETLKSLEEIVFYNCTALERIKLPDSLWLHRTEER